MSNSTERQADDVPAGDAGDNDYVSRPGQSEIPVTSDNKVEESPYQGEEADSDRQLEKDEKDAISEDNIIDERTRGAAKKQGGYREPGDDEGLPTDD